jgi:hypothetical protein
MRILERRRRVRGIARLAKDEIIRVDPEAGGVVLRAMSGTVWATQAGDRADHVLRAGDRIHLGGRGRVVLWAFEPAAVDVDAVPDTPSTPSEPAAVDVDPVPDTPAVPDTPSTPSTPRSTPRDRGRDVPSAAA